jgi:hypothetical protein
MMEKNDRISDEEAKKILGTCSICKEKMDAGFIPFNDGKMKKPLCALCTSKMLSTAFRVAELYFHWKKLKEATDIETNKDKR